MLAFRDENGAWQEWTGQPRPQAGQGDDLFSLPVEAAEDYHHSKLATFGLKKVTLTEVPEGKRIASWSLQDDAGTPVQVAVLEDLPGPTLEDLYDERTRRLEAGFDFDFQDERGVHRIGTSETDMIGWSEVTTLSSALIALGQGSQSVVIVTETGVAQITAIEWQQILIAAGQFRQPIWGASFALQSLETLPADFRDDGYWQ